MNQGAVVILSAVFGLAGALKLLERSSGRYRIGIFGEGQVVQIGMRMLPYLELAVAVGLLVPTVTPVAASFAFGLLILFTIVQFATLRSGNIESCGCFGEKSATHPSLGIARNALLLVAALVAALNPPLSIDPVRRAELVLLTITLAIAVIQSRRLEQLRRERTPRPALTQADPLHVSAKHVESASSAPLSRAQNTGSTLTHPDPLDIPVTFTNGPLIAPRQWLSDSRHLLLVFVDPVCGPCRRLLPAVASWQHASIPGLAIVVVSRGQIEENRLLAHELALAPIAVQHNDTLARRFGIAGTPSAILLDPDGRVVQGPVAGARDISSLAKTAAPELFRVGVSARDLAPMEVG
jgi:hypothetical protein